MSGFSRAVDLSPLFEDEAFLRAFCGGCPQAPRYFFEDCPACNDIYDERCRRRRVYLIIEGVLEKAQGEIIDTMRAAGCIPS